MTILPDLLSADLNVVFCGTAVSTTSAARGHYYSKPSNKFWQLLHDAGFTPDLLRPEDEVALPSLGIGITDLVKTRLRATTGVSTTARPPQLLLTSLHWWGP